MRLPWQCPTCYAELGDRSHAQMLTCPYCGSLLIVDSSHRKFLRVPKDGRWYYFPRGEEGLIVYGDFKERYIFRDRWYLIRDEIYVLEGETDDGGKVLEEGEVNYLWGEFPFVAPPGSVVRTLEHPEGLVKEYPGKRLLFLKPSEEIPDPVVEILQG